MSEGSHRQKSLTSSASAPHLPIASSSHQQLEEDFPDTLDTTSGTLLDGTLDYLIATSGQSSTESGSSQESTFIELSSSSSRTIPLGELVNLDQDRQEDYPEIKSEVMDRQQMDEFLQLFRQSMADLGQNFVDASSQQRNAGGSGNSIRIQPDLKTYPKYEGTTRFDIWVKTVESRFSINSLPNDAAKVNCLLSLIEGNLQQWIASQDDDDHLQSTYILVKEWLTTLFSGTMRDGTKIRDLLEAEKQKDGESVLEYVERKTKLFRKNALPLDIEFCRNVIKGIRKTSIARSVRMQVDLPYFKPAQFEEIVGAVIRNLDEEGSVYGHRSSTPSNQGSSNQHFSGTGTPEKQRPRSNSLPRSTGTPGSSNPDNKPGNCRKCGKPGHWAYECKQQRPSHFRVGEAVICADCFNNQSDPNLCDASHFQPPQFRSSHLMIEGAASAAPQYCPDNYSNMMAQILAAQKNSTSGAPVHIHLPQPSMPGNDNRWTNQGQPPAGN